MVDLNRMTSAEAELVEGLKEAWTTYGPALKDKYHLDGGMQWKTVKGREYLARYRQDAVSGSKVWTSLGRRSPETEAVYDDFMGRRGHARETIETAREDIALTGRLARAHGLSRLPKTHGEVLRAFWLNPADAQVTLFCGASLLAYEQDTRYFTPDELVRDDRLMFVFDPNVENVEIDNLLDAYEEAVGAKARVGHKDGVMTVQAADAVGIDFITERHLLDRADDDDQAELLSRALRAPPFRGVTVARGGQPVEIKTFAPQTFAMMAHVLGRDDDIWAERAEFAGALVRECWEFDVDQESIFPGIALDTDAAPPRF